MSTYTEFTLVFPFKNTQHAQALPQLVPPIQPKAGIRKRFVCADRGEEGGGSDPPPPENYFFEVKVIVKYPKVGLEPLPYLENKIIPRIPPSGNIFRIRFLFHVANRFDLNGFYHFYCDHLFIKQISNYQAKIRAKESLPFPKNTNVKSHIVYQPEWSTTLPSFLLLNAYYGLFLSHSIKISGS